MNHEQAKSWIDKTCGKGWLPLVDDIFNSLPEDVMVSSIYQKWGALMFDAIPWTDEVEALHDRIEQLSLQTCEICGSAATEAIIDDWVHTRCEQHSHKA